MSGAVIPGFRYVGGSGRFRIVRAARGQALPRRRRADRSARRLARVTSPTGKDAVTVESVPAGNATAETPQAAVPQDQDQLTETELAMPVGGVIFVFQTN